MNTLNIIYIYIYKRVYLYHNNNDVDDDEHGRSNMMTVMVILIIIIIIIQIHSTPDKSDSQGTGKSVRLSDISDLSEIQNSIQIRHEIRSVS